MALVAACVIDPGVYFAMNSPMAMLAPRYTRCSRFCCPVVSSWGFHITLNSNSIANDVGETSIISRAGGAPTLAVGMAYIHGALGGLMNVAFWYHFAILFEALFILTAVDAGTRAARFMLGLLGGFSILETYRFVTHKLDNNRAMCAGLGLFSSPRCCRPTWRY